MFCGVQKSYQYMVDYNLSIEVQHSCTATSYARAGCYPWETSPVLKRKVKGVDESVRKTGRRGEREEVVISYKVNKLF